MESIERIIKKFGRSVYVTSDSYTSEIYKALVQPLRYKNKMYVGGTNSEMGLIEENYYLYLGPADKDFEKMGNSLFLHTADSKRYSVTKSEKVYSGENACYIWAVIKERF